MTSLLPLLVISVPWAGALAVITIGDQRPAWQHRLAVLVAVVTAGLAWGLAGQLSSEPALEVALGGVFGTASLVIDGLGLLLTLVATNIGALAVVFSVSYMADSPQLGRYYALVLVFIGAMVGLVLSGGLVLLFIFWELTALCSYALIAFENDRPEAVAGGIRALIMTQLGGLGLMFSALLLAGSLGSDQIGVALTEGGELAPGVLALAGYGMIFAAAAKSAQVPFHTWLPGAMEAPTPISALIHAATMVNAGVYLLARFAPLFAEVPGWSTTVMTVGVVTALLAALLACTANDLKAALAYSTVSQLGYMVYAIGVGAVFASLFHLLSHAIFKALLFLAAGAVIHSVHTRDMGQMGGLGKRMPFVQAAFALGALALAGLPMMNGYWSKDLILDAGRTDGPLWSYALMLLGAGLTGFYSLRMMARVFWGPPSKAAAHAHEAAPPMQMALGTLGAASVVSWLLAEPLSEVLHATLPAHHVHVEALPELIPHVLQGSLIVLPVVAVGLLVWLGRGYLAGMTPYLGWLAAATRAEFGFTWLNQQVVGAARSGQRGMQALHLGQLNWNLAGLVLGLSGLLLALLYVVLRMGA